MVLAIKFLNKLTGKYELHEYGTEAQGINELQNIYKNHLPFLPTDYEYDSEFVDYNNVDYWCDKIKKGGEKIMKLIYEKEDYRVYKLERICKRDYESDTLVLCDDLNVICVVDISSKHKNIFNFTSCDGYVVGLHDSYIEALTEAYKNV